MFILKKDAIFIQKEKIYHIKSPFHLFHVLKTISLGSQLSTSLQKCKVTKLCTNHPDNWLEVVYCTLQYQEVEFHNGKCRDNVQSVDYS